MVAGTQILSRKWRSLLAVVGSLPHPPLVPRVWEALRLDTSPVRGREGAAVATLNPLDAAQLGDQPSTCQPFVLLCWPRTCGRDCHIGCIAVGQEVHIWEVLCGW